MPLCSRSHLSAPSRRRALDKDAPNRGLRQGTVWTTPQFGHSPSLSRRKLQMQHLPVENTGVIGRSTFLIRINFIYRSPQFSNTLPTRCSVLSSSPTGVVLGMNASRIIKTYKTTPSSSAHPFPTRSLSPFTPPTPLTCPSVLKVLSTTIHDVCLRYPHHVALVRRPRSTLHRSPTRPA